MSPLPRTVLKRFELRIGFAVFAAMLMAIAVSPAESAKQPQTHPVSLTETTLYLGPIEGFGPGYGFCLDGDSNNIYTNGDKVQIWQCNGQLNQSWYVNKWSSGNITWYTIENAADGKCLDADTTTFPANGTKIQLWDCGPGYQQHWLASEAYNQGDNQWQFRSIKTTSKCIDRDRSVDLGNGNKVQVWDCNNPSDFVNQVWYVPNLVPNF